MNLRRWLVLCLSILMVLGIANSDSPSCMAQNATATQPDISTDGTTVVRGTCFGPISYQVTLGIEMEAADVSGFQEKVQRRLDEINQKMSTYLEDSDVSRFNRSEDLDWFPVDAETAKVVQQALELSKKTEGAFDITVGPLVRLWKFGAGVDPDSSFQMPSDEEIQKVRQQIGYQKLQVQLDPPAIKKSIPDLEIDLSAIAKGYAVDEVAGVVVTQTDLDDYFVEVGEEVRASGKHPAGRDWICGIEKPLEDVRAIAVRVPLNDAAIATSGDYRQFRIVDGKRISHTIDPRTGLPTDGHVALASVYCESCATADALATAMMVLGKEQAMTLAKRESVGLHLVVRSDSGQQTTITNADYPRSVSAQSKTAGVSWLIPAGVSLLIFGGAIVAMSVGVMFKREPIKGSCGGLANMPGNEQSPCELCSNPSKECRELGRGAKRAAAESNCET